MASSSALAAAATAAAVAYWLGVIGFVAVLYLAEYWPASIPDAARRATIRDWGSSGKLLPARAGRRLPKSWFRHFYLIGTVWLAAISSWFWTQSGFAKPALVSSLFALHCCRRLLECLFVSVYSSQSTMHAVVYVASISYYVMVGVSIVVSVPDPPGRVSAADWVLSGAFCMLNVVQHHHVRLLAALRAGRDRDRHYVPGGALFEYVACPHYLVEIGLYLNLHVLIGPGVTVFTLCLVAVALNQVLLASIAHRWYQVHFPSYAGRTRAILPFAL